MQSRCIFYLAFFFFNARSNQSFQRKSTQAWAEHVSSIQIISNPEQCRCEASANHWASVLLVINLSTKGKTRCFPSIGEADNSFQSVLVIRGAEYGQVSFVAASWFLIDLDWRPDVNSMQKTAFRRRVWPVMVGSIKNGEKIQQIVCLNVQYLGWKSLSPSNGFLNGARSQRKSRETVP